MKEYIDKAALVSELEKRIEETKGMQPQFDQFWAGQISAFKGVLKILDTLEVKEVNLEECQKENIDLEKEVNQYFEKTWPFEEDDEDIIAFARHFFELGLKAQKGE